MTHSTRDQNGYPIADQPHPDAVFDPMWRSNHGPSPMDGWRFVYRCAAGCPDAIGDTPATRDPEDFPKTCPDCNGPTERISGGGKLDQYTRIAAERAHREGDGT